MSESCERIGISRKKFEEAIGRFDAEGTAGLEEQSLAPVKCHTEETSEPRR